MLSLLHIENIAIIESADISFDRGFNVLTGETGAGKSIVIDAISAVLGERTSRELIRTGAKSALVNAVFTGSLPLKWLEDNGFSQDGEELMLQREIHGDGRNACRVNGRPLTVAQLRELGRQLLNIHGQHDGQQLLDPDCHLGYLDSFGKMVPLLENYQSAYRSLSDLRRRIAALEMDEAERSRRVDTLEYQIKELERAELRPGEDEELDARKTLLRSSGKLMEAIQEAQFALFGGEGVIGAFTVEPAAMIVLGVICAAFFKFDRQPDRPYKLYRAVAPLIGAGFLLMAVSPLPDEVGGFCVALGYVLFELLVLNDCCNIVKANDASLLRVMAAARLAITLGMFLGWLAAFAAASLAGAAESVSSLVALGLFAALVSVSLVFTERDMTSFAAVADDRALSEGALEGPTREEAFAAFAEQRGLSRREAEVASYLLAGRTTSFAAEKLFIAESTVRAHVHSIYRKCGVHSRMELMDAFDECWSFKASDL